MDQEVLVPANCHECIHRISISGNTHIGCNNPKADPDRVRWPGSGIFPLAYDPATIRTCNTFSTDLKDALPVKNDPLLEMFRILLG